jgi:hypothetical protein
MFKVFFIFIFSLNILNGMVFANDLISQSKIFPYLLTYNKDIKDKTFNNSVNFVIIYDKFSKNSAIE